MRSPVREGVIALAAVALLVSCTKGPTEGGDSPAATGSPTRKALDLSGDPRATAAVTFDSKAAHVLPTGPAKDPTVVLYGRAAWHAHASGVTMYNLATGKAVTTIKTQNTPAYDLPAPRDLSKKQADMISERVSRPEPVRIGGVPAMLTVVPVKLAKKGKGSAQAGFEVIAARADNGKLIWRLPVDIYGAPAAGKLGVFGVSIADGVVAVTWTQDDYAQGTVAVSLDDEPRMLWQRAGFWKLGGSSEALVGFRDDPEQDYPLTGVAPADGRDLWDKKMPQGTTRVLDNSPFAKFDEDGSKQAQLLDLTTGDFVLPKRAGLTSRMDCSQGEGGTVLLCASKQDGALAVDEDGKILWRRAAGDGAKDWSGTLTADFKDLFYAKGKDGTFVVDGRTGRTVGTDAGVVPDRVNAYAALVFTGTGAEVHLAKR
ncbi:hypothetical protein QQY66_15350 [Streptomyces sp. DG2A-72]|uniref:hypothetical protein n=1 Tax=Streptomyces sp. DG2A-72 TaxID=3051386 RepID=UPI00265C8A68|nr:hypothetical protein [Streptomyces sp. DG2A-72]MDO0932998.1 hypothetical protein [Streptomyces sp. DG2A-72]